MKHLTPFQVVTDQNVPLNQDHFQKGIFVLFFYPKDNTPGCTKEACDFRDHFANFNKHSVTVYGVSRDDLKSHQKFKEKFTLPYTLLTDESGDLCMQLDVWKQKTFMGRKYMGIERSTFVIQDGVILHEWRNVKIDGHSEAVYQFIQTLLPAA